MTSGNSLSTAGVTKLAAMLIVGVIVIAAILAPMLNNLTHETIVEDYNNPDDASWIRMNYGAGNYDTEYSVAGDTLIVGDQSGTAQDMILYADEKACVIYSDGFTIVNGYSDPATITKAESVHITNADGILTISDGTDIIIQTSSPAWAYYPDSDGIYSFFGADVQDVRLKDGDNIATVGSFASVYAYNDIIAELNGVALDMSMNTEITDGVIDSVDWEKSADENSAMVLGSNQSSNVLRISGSASTRTLNSANPSSGTQIGDLYYTFSGSDATVVGYSSSIDWSTFTTIPDTVTDNGVTYTVTSIGDEAFSYCDDLALTSLPSGLTSIGDYAFSSCYYLELTSLPSGVTSIGDYAFESTNIALTSLPSGLTTISSHAFDSCSNLALTSLPSGVTSIGDNAFRGCTNLKSLIIQSSPTLGNSVFSECANLKEILNLGSTEITTTTSGLNADEVRSDIPAMGYVAPLSITKVVEKEDTAYDILLMMPVLLVIALLIPLAQYFVGDNRSRVR